MSQPPPYYYCRKKCTSSHDLNPMKREVITESLRITDAERHATSMSMYGDSTGRISSNYPAIHDRVRHKAYDVLHRTVKGKRVLHIGCGMGLYSMLAAQAQAAHVVAIDHSSVVDPAREVARQNKLSNITFIRGYLRDVLQLLPEPQALYDVIICEWMGAFLVNERVLTDVLYARDHLLAPGGTVSPSSSSLHVCGVSDYMFRQYSEEYWSNVYGFSMEPMKDLVRKDVGTRSIHSNMVATSSCRIATVELDTLPKLSGEDLEAYLAAGTKAKEERRLKAENPILAQWVPSETAVKGLEANFELTVTKDCTVYYLAFFVDAVYTDKANPGANFVIGINPGGANPWTEVSVGLLDPLPVVVGEIIRGTVRTYTPREKGGKVTVVEVTAKTEGKVAAMETSGTYYYQCY